jgi:hypothetical protein
MIQQFGFNIMKEGPALKDKALTHGQQQGL